MRLPRSLPLALLPFVAACSSEPRVLTIHVVTGHETDAMTQDPPIAKVKVKGTTPEGEVVEAETAPGGDLDFGEVDGDLAYSFEVTGLDGSGNVALRGRSKSGIVLNAITGDSLPLFAQRLDAWARPPGELSRAHTRAPAAHVGERYLLTTGGEPRENAAATEQYDLFAWAGASGETLPFAAQTLVSEVNRLMAIGADPATDPEKNAVWLESTGQLNTPLLPDGLTSFADVAGGAVVVAPDFRAFVVGATRPENPTDAVLEIATDGTLTTRRLGFPRAGAAAVWLPDVGLVVIGGSDTGNAVEVLPDQGTSFAARDFPPDATTGAGAVVNNAGTIALIGGTLLGQPAKTRSLDPRCTSDCKTKDIDAATPPLAVARVKAFPVGTPPGTRALAVGDEVDPDGTTRAFVIDLVEPGVTELPLREPRRGATLTDTPIGTLALIGGLHPDGTPALTVEMYFPE